MKAWTFYRRSTEKQEVSVEDQRRICQKRAEELGLEIVREFVPSRGYASGLTIDRDGAFIEMTRLAESKTHGVGVLLIYDVSRFGRLPPKEKFYWEEHFRRCGVKIVYAAENFQYDGSLGDEIHQFVSHSEAHQFSIRLSKSTTRGCITHASRGHSCGGSAPYGYDRLLVNGDGSPVKVLRKGEHKADKLQRVVWTAGERDRIAIVRRMFDEYDKGIGGLKKIASRLNVDGIKSPRGGHWTMHGVLSILRNPVYIGRRVYFKHDWRAYRMGSEPAVRDPKDWVIAENAHEAILDRDIFERVQAKLGPERWGKGRSSQRPWLLSGLTYCLACNHRFNGYHKSGKAHGILHEQDYYNCAGYVSKGRSVCQSFHVVREDVESFAINEIVARLSSPSLRDDLRRNLEDLVRVEFAERPKTTEQEIRKAIRGCEDEMNNLLDAIKKGLKWDRAQDEIARLESQRQQLAAELEALRQTQAVSNDFDEIVEEMLSYLEEFGRLLEKGTVEQKKAVLRSFVHRIVFDREQRKATYSFFTVPVIPQLKSVPYPKEIAGSALVGTHRRSITNIGCGGWI